jgi:predicted ATPase
MGRQRELAMLYELVAEVEEGRGQVVGIVGEPGMGKSRLLWEFRQTLTGRQVLYLEGHCLAYAQATPYLPVLDILRQQAEITEVNRPEAIVEKVCLSLQAVGMDLEAGAPCLFQLMGLKEGLEPLANLTLQALKARTFDTLGQWLFGTTQQQPLVLAIEDLHWIDPTSAEFLASWVERLAGSRIMLLCTYRPGYQPPWLHKSYTTQLSLKPLSRHNSQCVLQSVLPTEALPDVLAQTILSKAEGNPFFLEELAYTVREQELQHAGLALPETIQGVLMVRIDGLPEAPKRLLQTLAVIGKPCHVSRLTQILDRATDELHGHLAILQRGEFIDEQPASPESKYGVKHALMQDIAYEAQGFERCQEQHRRIAQAIEALGPDHLQEYSGELAHHYQRSGDTTRAVLYHQQAGQWAMQRSAFGEAVSHFTTAVEQLRTLPETPERTQQELDLWIALGPALLATQGPGAAEVEQAYHRARELCQQVGKTSQLFPALVGLWRYYQLRAEQRTARDLGERLL